MSSSILEDIAIGWKGKASEMASTKEDEEDKNPFSHYYSMLAHQQNMMQDTTRTGTYHKAVMNNKSDFRGKTILDVGTGSGILAMFAAKAGAKKVFAVEASNIAPCARKLVKANGLEKVVEVVQDKVENVKIDKCDLIISEPMGFLLVHERMLESFVRARDLFLKPGGKMFPSLGTMYFLPYCDWQIYNEQTAKADFWKTTDFYDVDLSCLHRVATEQHFSQPVVGYFEPSIFIADYDQVVTHEIDFQTISPEQLHDITISFKYTVNQTTLLHGIATWFDVDFLGSSEKVKLSTGPYDPPTHWYQCRLMLTDPIAVNKTQSVSGTIVMKVNEKFSYDIDLTVRLDGTDIISRNRINLHDQFYHYLQSPTQTNHLSSDNAW